MNFVADTQLYVILNTEYSAHARYNVIWVTVDAHLGHDTFTICKSTTKRSSQTQTQTHICALSHTLYTLGRHVCILSIALEVKNFLPLQ